MDSLLVGLRLRVVGLYLDPVVVELAVEFGDLIGRQPEVLLGISDFFSKGLILLHQVLHLPPDAVVFALVFMNPPFVFLQLLESLGLLGVRETNVLLRIPHFVGQSGVLVKEGLDLLLQDFALLVVGADLVLEVGQFLGHPGVLVGRQAQALLGSDDLLIEGLLEVVDFVVLGLDDAVESFYLLGKHGHLVFMFSSFSGGVAESSLKFFIFVTDDFQFIVQL